MEGDAVADLKKLRDEILAEQLEDMAPAEKRSAALHKRAEHSRLIDEIGGAFGGYTPSQGYADSLDARARSASAEGKARSGLKSAAMGEARQIAASQDAAAKESAENDPASPQSVADAELAGRLTKQPDVFRGMSSAQIKKSAPFLREFFEAEQAKRSAAEKAEATRAGNAEWDRRNAITSQQEIEQAKIMAGIKAAAPEKQPTVPAGEASQVGELSAATKMADDLWKEWESKASAPGSGLLSKVPGTDAAQYPDAQKAAAQSIGTILEGGKLTDADLAKYMALVPTPSDGAERARAKIDRLKRMIEEKKAAKVKGLGQAGYKVGGFDAGAPDAAPPAAGGLSPEQKARLEELRRKRAGQ